MSMVSKADICIHQVCFLEQCDFASSLDVLARNQVGMTAVWRPMLDAVGEKTARKMLDDSGVQAHALCALELLKGIEHSTRMLEIAASVGAKSIVAITGGFDANETTLEQARSNAVEMLAILLPIAKSFNITIALEPLHPMVCGLRSVISSLREANEILDQLDMSDHIGIALDSYAVVGTRPDDTDHPRRESYCQLPCCGLASRNKRCAAGSGHARRRNYCVTCIKRCR